MRAGDRIAGRLGEITDPTKLEVFTHVSEESACKIKVGQEIVLTAEGVPGRRFRGRVATVGTVAHAIDPWEDASASPSDRVFDVRVTLLEIDPKVLRPGMKAEVTFVFHRLPQGYLGAFGGRDSPAGEGRICLRAAGELLRGAGGGNRGAQRPGDCHPARLARGRARRAR